MPVIPYPQRTATMAADAPAPVLDTLRRPTVNADATVRGVARLAQASQISMIDADPFVAQDRALANIGRGIAEAGGVMQHLAAKRKEAKDYTDTVTAKAALDDATVSFSEWKLKNPDPSTWEDGWKSHFSSAQKEVLSNPSLSPEAREKITMTAGMMERRGLVNTSLDAAKTTFQQAASAAVVSADNLFVAGDVDGGKKVLEEAVSANYLDGADAHRLLKAGEAVAERKNNEAIYNQNYGAILADADGWLEANAGNKNGLDPRLHNALESQAMQQQRMNLSAVSSRFADAMATDGAIKTEADIETMLAGQRPAVVLQAKQDWAKLRDARTQAYNASLPGLLRNTGEMMARIDQFNPKADGADGERVRLEYLIKSTVPEGYRSGLISKLDAKFNPPKTPVDPTVKSWADDQVSAWFKDGRFGSTTRPVRDGEPGYVPPIDRWFGPDEEQQQTETVADPAARDAAMSARAKVEMDFVDWMRKNPNASIEEAQKALGGIARDKVKSADVDTMLAAPLPETGGRTGADILRSFRGPAAPSAALFPDMGDNLSPLEPITVEPAGFGPETDMPTNPGRGGNPLVLPR